MSNALNFFKKLIRRTFYRNEDAAKKKENLCTDLKELHACAVALHRDAVACEYRTEHFFKPIERLYEKMKTRARSGDYPEHMFPCFDANIATIKNKTPTKKYLVAFCLFFAEDIEEKINQIITEPADE